MYIMLQIILKHTHRVVAGMNRMRQITLEYTHPLTLLFFGKALKKKKNDCKASLIRETFKGTNITFSFFLSLSSHLSAVCRSSSA